MTTDRPDELTTGEVRPPDTKDGGPDVCTDCGGTGRVGPELCAACHGTGEVEELG
jgi:DnaJ-class molecular chaperone